MCGLTYMYIYIYTHMYTYVYIYIYIYMYTYIYILDSHMAPDDTGKLVESDLEAVL